MNDYPSNVLAVTQILVTAVDVLKGVFRRHEFVELELTCVVEPQQPDDVVLRIRGAEQSAPDRLFAKGEHGAGDVDGRLRGVSETHDDDRTALADDVERLGNHSFVHGADRNDRLVGALAPRQFRLGPKTIR